MRDQAIITTAGAHRALRAQRLGYPLEHGEVVIIEPAHQTRVDAVGNHRILEQLLDALKMLERCLAEKVDQLRRALDQHLHRRILGIQDTQWIGMQAAARFLIQLVGVAFQIGDQCGAVLRTFLGLAERIDFKLDVAITIQPEVVP